MTHADSRSFLGTLIGDGRPLIIFSALALAFAGLGAIFLSVTGHFLPHDVDFLGMQPSALCELNQCRIVHFMIHDRMSFGGVILSIAVLYLWLALFPLKEGESWAWWTLALTNATGFGSFLAYMGYGYLDHWHAWATGGLLPVALWGLCRTRKLCRGPLDLRPAWASGGWRSADALCRLPWFGWGLGTVGAGITILIVGMTQVFVPSDLSFLGYTRADLDAINPRLIPLIAHDRGLRRGSSNNRAAAAGHSLESTDVQASLAGAGRGRYHRLRLRDRRALSDRLSRLLAPGSRVGGSGAVCDRGLLDLGKLEK